MTTKQELHLRPEISHAGAEEDQRVQLQLEMHLKRHLWFSSDADISCEFREGVVVLRGHVSSFHQKQMAQELARKMKNVKMIVNRLAVDASDVSNRVSEAIFSSLHLHQPMGNA